MPIAMNVLDRKVIPPWRDYEKTLASREITSLEFSNRKPDISAPFEQLLRDWREHRSFSFAADAVAAAIVLGRENEARDAAQFILDNADDTFLSARASAALIITPLTTPKVDDNLPLADQRTLASSKIHLTKYMLRLNQYDPTLWTDLAYYYSSLGNIEKAKSAITVALALAPENRFILRSSARFYIHLNEHDKAHDILRSAESTRFDPWLIASEIAAAAVANRRSRLIHSAEVMIKRERFAPFHLSELSSALGTLEAHTGDTKHARKYFSASLVDPAENALAQAAWARRTFPHIPISETVTGGDLHSHEASTWSFYLEAKWAETASEAMRWQADQPFSARPAIVGSFISCTTLGNYEQAIRILNRALISNPREFILLNNLAYSYAQAEQLKDAISTFRRIPAGSLTREQDIVWRATGGLLEYRRGRHQVGREMYLEAIQAAQKVHNGRYAILALLCLAREELRTGATKDSPIIAEAFDAATKMEFPELVPFVERLRKATG